MFLKPVNNQRHHSTAWVLVLLWLWLLVGCAPAPAPKINLTTSDGVQMPLADFKGRWVLINYWAVWCKPCIEEVQELNAFAAAYPDVSVVGVNFDQPPIAELRRQMAQLDIRFLVVTSNLGQHFGYRRAPEVLPTTLLINPEGAGVKTLVGSQNFNQLEAALGQARGY